MTSTVADFWREFLAADPDVPRDTAYQSWYFGDNREMALELAALVLAGRKTATASLSAVNAAKPEIAPVLGGFSVVTDLDHVPICIIRTTEIREMPFCEVDEDFAKDEGEGDLSLEWWRRAHRDYYTREAAETGVEFNDSSIVCCERFELLFPK